MEAKTLFEYLCRTYEGSFQEVQRGGKGAIRSAKLPHDQLVYNEVSMFCEQLPRIGEGSGLDSGPGYARLVFSKLRKCSSELVCKEKVQCSRERTEGAGSKCMGLP